jgi:hypothetical protein
MHKRVCLLFCLVALTMLASASRASADVRDRDGYRDNVRLYGGLWLGFGGNADVDYAGPLGIRASAPNDDQVTTIGGQVGFDIPVLRFLSLGGEARMGAFNTKGLDDNGIDRSKLIDLDFKPRLTFPLRRSPIELYFAVPVGLTIPILADDFGNGNAVDANVGWNLGIGAGINFWLTQRIALNLEPNYLMHWFDLDLPVGSGVKLQQFTLFFNAVFAL